LAGFPNNGRVPGLPEPKSGTSVVVAVVVAVAVVTIVASVDSVVVNVFHCCSFCSHIVTVSVCV